MYQLNYFNIPFMECIQISISPSPVSRCVLSFIILVLAVATAYDIVFVQMSSFWIRDRSGSKPIIAADTMASSPAMNSRGIHAKFSANDISEGKNGLC